MLQQVLAVQRMAAREKQLDLQLKLVPGLPASYVCDRAKLHRVLDILLRNAVQVTERGSIVLEAETGPGRVVFRVRDSGPGVPETVRLHLFEHFTMADDSATRGRDGAGLGLAIAARLVQVMGGRIQLDSSDSTGAVFSVSLPYLRLPQLGEFATSQQEQPS